MIAFHFHAIALLSTRIHTAPEPMLPLAYTWPACIPYRLAYGWAYMAELRRVPGMRRSVVSEMDRGSLQVILWTIAVTNIGAFVFAGLLRTMAITASGPSYICGIALIISGGLLRRHCFTMLGERFTYAVNATPHQTVVESGAYRFIRHPSYLAGLIKFAGIGLGLGNWASLALCIVLPALAYSYRIPIEERALDSNDRAGIHSIPSVHADLSRSFCEGRLRTIPLSPVPTQKTHSLTLSFEKYRRYGRWNRMTLVTRMTTTRVLSPLPFPSLFLSKTQISKSPSPASLKNGDSEQFRNCSLSPNSSPNSPIRILWTRI